MIFHIGPWAYRVRITDEPPQDDQGRQLSGKAVRETREILIPDEPHLPRSQRFNSVLHEVKHLWLMHFPKPRTEEEDCEMSAAIMAQAHNDLNAQGGEAALEAMELPTTAGDEVRAAAKMMRQNLLGGLDPQDLGLRNAPVTYVDRIEAPRNRASGHRVQCGVCELVVAGGSVANGPARFDLAAGGFVLERQMYCPHCDHVQKWTEGADLEGRPNGGVVSDPVILRGKAVEEFLVKHGHAVGVIVG